MKARFVLLAVLLSSCGQGRSTPGHDALAQVRGVTGLPRAVSLLTLREHVVLPETAASPMRFGTLGLAADVAAQRASSREDALVFADVSTETDLVLRAVEGGVEELRVLYGERAPRTFRWTVDHGHVRVVGGRIELHDEEGALRVKAAPPFAVDANGVRRELTVHAQGNALIAELDAAGLAFPIVVDPVWQTVVSTLPSPSSYYAYSWVQPNTNFVLQLGGTNNSNEGTAWFDVPTEKWTLKTLSTPHTYARSIWIPSINKALVAGGQTGGGTQISTATIYDPSATSPATDLTATMSVGRAFHTLTLVNPGPTEKVLVVGGGSTATVSVDWFDPATFTFVARAPLSTARTHHAAIRLTSGKVLVTGGRPSASTGAISTGEVYDPSANTWTAITGTMSARAQHTQSLLPSGKVLILGGYDGTGNPLASSVLYDPTTNALTAGPSMTWARGAHAVTTLADGRVLVSGGQARLATGIGGGLSNNTTEIYDPATNAFSDGPTMVAARYAHDTALLSGGRVMVGTGPGTSSTEILWPDGTTCSGTSTTCPFCVDGVCCDSACTGQCDACDLPGKKGVCSPVNGEAPHGARASCTPFAACVYDATKVASACATSCSSDATCGSTSYCQSPGTSGTCAPKKADGAGCGGNNQCTSGKCVDGVCCKTDCSGQCASCAEAGSVGTCVNVDGMPRGSRTACAAPYACAAGVCATSCTKDAHCATGRTCDTASGTCVPKKGDGTTCTASAQCISGQCVDGVCCNTDCTSACFACDLPGKAGTCSALPEGTAPHGARSCTPYALCAAAGACKTSCSSGADCLSGVCDSASKLCTAASSDAGVDGSTDTGSDTGSSSDTGSASDSGSVSDSGGDLGTADKPAPDPGPKPVVGEFIKCSKSSECASGHCVEGVCCDSECKDKCHSCALLTSPGKCTLEPIGVDLKNECGPALSCLGTCNGTGECIGAGKGTMCARNRCTGATSGVGPAYCPAPGGKCATDDVVSFECGPYVCEPAFGACATSCKTSGDCANGFACDTDKKTCVAAAAPESDDGGCSTSSRPSGSARGLGLLIVALSMMARRRSR